MAMLDARAFWRRYGCGATVFDAMGRELKGVIASNPETGEVIMLETRPFIVFLVQIFNNFYAPVDGGQLVKRHGFWPAPFNIRPPDPPKPSRLWP